MDAEKVRLPNESETYLPTLYGKALDSRAEHPILGDTFADDVVHRIDFDFAKLKFAKGGAITLPMRAKHLDSWTREFLAANPRSTVLHLGCGLDSRVFRIDPPATVRWYDVDLPDVIELRRRLYPQRHDYELIATSVTDLRWLDGIGADRPVIVVAEGLVQYLPEQDGVALFKRITEQFPSGQIIFDAYSRLTVRLISLMVRLITITRNGVPRAAEVMRDRPLLRYRRRFWLAIAAVLVTLGVLYALVIRPYHMHWGATDQEVAMALPGDAAIPGDAAVSTRAITIHAPAATVWAWLVQTGQNRGGGWHSYDWLENLFAADMHEVDRIDPQWQQLRVGDTMFFHAAGATNPVMVAPVTLIEPERALVLGAGWSFVLQPIDPSTTRLIVRYPMKPDEFVNPLLSFGVFEPAHFVMESGMLLGIKRRAERDPQLRNGGTR